jgi:hypothetical protein
MPKDTSWITVVAVVLLVRWLAWEASAERAVQKSDVLVFRAPALLRILFGFAVPTMVYGAGSVVASGKFRQEWWVSLTLLVMAVSIVWMWPSDIRLSNDGIVQRRLLGLWARRFAWGDVEYLRPDPSEDSFEVVSTAGRAIKHTKYHVDRERFVAEVKRHVI